MFGFFQDMAGGISLHASLQSRACQATGNTKDLSHQGNLHSSSRPLVQTVGTLPEWQKDNPPARKAEWRKCNIMVHGMNSWQGLEHVKGTAKYTIPRKNPGAADDNS